MTKKMASLSRNGGSGFIPSECFRADRPRTVVHLNIADFAVAVERQLDSRLKDYPVIIAPTASARAVVYDMSEEAFRAGVAKQMPLSRAVRRCPDAIIIPPHEDRYAQGMEAILREVLPYSPLIEPGEADGHVFIDITGTSRLFGPPVDVAWRMYRRIKDRLGFAPVWSVAPNKLVAKVATRLVKPRGEYIIDEGEESDFLAPLPLSVLPGMEPEDLLRFKALNLERVHQAAGLTLDQLSVPFGHRAGFVFQTLRGIDPSPVLAAGQKPPQILAVHEFIEDTPTREGIEGAVYGLAEKIGVELRRMRKAARMLAMAIDYSDGVRRTRRMRVNPPSAHDRVLFQTARFMLDLAWTRRVRLRRMRLICEKPVFPSAQMALFPDPAAEKQEALTAAVDRIRERFGRRMILTGPGLAS